MSALAFGPGSGVLMSGTLATAPLFPLPARACGRILEEDAARGELVADAIGRREIAAPAGRMALLDAALDFLGRNRRRLVFGPPERQHAEDAVEALECLVNHRNIALSHPAFVNGGVERLDELENRAERGSGVQVVRHRLG